MSIHFMLLLLAVKQPIKHEALDVLPAPQISCPLSLKEYSKHFRWWARQEVIERQFDLAVESHRELLKGQI